MRGKYLLGHFSRAGKWALGWVQNDGGDYHLKETPASSTFMTLGQLFTFF